MSRKRSAKKKIARNVAHWTNWDTIPLNAMQGSMIQLNPNEVVLTSPRNHKDAGIHIYNIVSNEWRLFMKWRERLSYLSTYFDHNRKILYVVHKFIRSPARLLSLNMENKQKKVIDTHDCYNPCYMVGTKNDIHFIGGGNGNSHYIFNKETEEFKLIHTFKTFTNMANIHLVYIKSQNVILSIGGHAKRNDSRRYKERFFLNCRRFDLDSKKWKKMKNIEIQFPVGHAILTKNEKHIILIKGRTTQKSDDMYILDIINKGHNYRLRMSKIDAPTITDPDKVFHRHFVLTGSNSDDINELLVYGFMRSCNYQISTDVISVICVYCNDELLHCFRLSKGSNEHFVISVTDAVQ